MSAPQPTLTGLARGLQGPREAACPRSSNCLSAAHAAGRRRITVHGNFSSAKGLRNSRSHGTMPNQALSAEYAQCVISAETRENRAEIQAFQVFFDARSHVAVLAGKRYRTAKIRCRAAGPPQGRRHAGARQGQIHRRFQPARPGLCLDRALQPRPRHHPRHRHQGRQGDAGRARRLDRQGPRQPPATTPSPAACR